VHVTLKAATRALPLFQCSETNGVQIQMLIKTELLPQQILNQVIAKSFVSFRFSRV